MSKIVIAFTEKHSYRKMRNILSQNQKLSTVVLNFKHPRFSCFQKICLEFGSQIFKLVLLEVYFENIQEFTTLLKSLPNVKTIEIIKWNSSYNNFAQTNEFTNFMLEPVVMYNLNSFSAIILEKCLPLFCYFIAPHIKSFSIKIIKNLWEYNKSSDEMPDFFIRQLRTAKELEFLDIFEMTDHMIMLREIDFPFKLKTFKMMSYVSRHINENNLDVVLLCSFLESQAQSLLELDFNMTCATNEKNALIMGVIFNQLKCLKKLHLDAILFPKQPEFYNNLELFESLMELEVSHSFPNELVVKSILENLPNLEMLKAVEDEHIPNLLSFLAVTNLKLQKLYVMMLNKKSLAEIPSLKYLHVEFFGDFEVFQDFLGRNLSVTNLSIKLDDNIDVGAVFSSIMDRTNINHLKCKGNYKPLKALFDQIKIDYKNLHSIELTVTTKIGASPTIALNFPENINFSFAKRIPQPKKRIEISQNFGIDDPYF